VPTRVGVVRPTPIEFYPQWRGHRYFVVNDDIVIVDRSHKTVATLPMGSSGGGGRSSTAASVLAFSGSSSRRGTLASARRSEVIGSRRGAHACILPPGRTI
jgi:hypothetical protein